MKYDAIKKFVSAVLSAVIVTSTVPISTNASSINTSSRIIGDLDGDFRITSADALLILENPCFTWFPWLFAVGFSVVPAFCFSCRFRFVFAYFRRFLCCRGYFIGFDILSA